MGASSVPIIPNGVDLKSFRPRTIEMDLQRGTLTVGYFGHLTESWFDWDLIYEDSAGEEGLGVWSLSDMASPPS